MKRAQVHAQRVVNGESPLEVIAHARRAVRRGRKPSMTYKGELNPQHALKLALADVGVNTADPQHIELHDVPVPLGKAPAWVSVVRDWVHCMRAALKGLQIPFEIASPLDDYAVARAMPELMRAAGQLGLPSPPLRRLPVMTHWHDSNAPRIFMLNELQLWAVRHLFRPSMV